MRKNGSRIISFGRYRATDLLMFVIILTVFDVVSYFAFTKWFASDISNFFFSIAIPISLLVMVRWNWYGMFYAVFDGVLYCTMVILGSKGAFSGAELQYFLTYGIGNAFVGLAYLMVRFAGGNRLFHSRIGYPHRCRCPPLFDTITPGQGYDGSFRLFHTIRHRPEYRFYWHRMRP